ncbi:MAG: ArnT family glycosyltransferase [Crocosphaera sp.]
MLKLEKFPIYSLITVLILTFLLRVLFLGTIPNGLFTDEASNAYDAYSILHTLRDQYGEFLPRYFKSANDYREGLYMYLMVPFIKIFGLNTFGARITSAVIGTLTVFIVYHLAKEIFDQKVGLLSALFLAILPWHIHFSRVTFRAILVPCLFCLGLLLFYKSFKHPKWLVLSSFLFAISIYTYNSARVFVPLFLLGLAAIYWEHLWKNRYYTILSFITFSILFIPQLIYQLSPEGMARANTVGIQTDFNKIVSDYFSYFSFDFLFFEGDPSPRHKINNMAGLYAFQIPFILLGFLLLIKEKAYQKWVLYLWLILYPIPAAFISPESAVRTLVVTPLFAIISGYAVCKITDFSQGIWKQLFAFLLIGVVFANLVIYSQRYVFDYPRWHTDVWLSTLGETISYADKTSYECIIYSDHVYGSYAYIMIPFFTKMPPAQYHQYGVDIVQNKLDMGRWKIKDLEKLETFNPDCLYVLYGESNTDNPKGEDGEIIDNKGYQERFIHSFKDINDVERYRLVEIEKKT